MADVLGKIDRDGRDLVADYARPSLTSLIASERYDEMIDPVRGVRGPWRTMAVTLRRLDRGGLADWQQGVDRLLADDGVTYHAPGSLLDQPWSLDPIPMVLDDAEWAALEAGVRQRAELLDLVLADLYGPRELLSAGLLPPEVVYGHAGFVRAVDGLRLPAASGAQQLFLAAADLARDSDGRWQVISDRAQAPSGAGYAMENRGVVSQVLPGLYRDSRVQRLDPFFQQMRLALQQLAPVEAPRVVLLTPGVHAETAFDQAYLSALLGFPLVEGGDLTVRDGRVWQRSIGGLEPVDVIVRRVDAWFCDPLELRPDSRLGVAGLVQAARLGSVAIVNGLGAGVIENAGLFPFLPRIAEVLLRQPLQLPSVPTWWCGDELSRRHVLARLESLVINPIARQVARSSVFGWELSAAERDDLARQIEAEPYAWVGQTPLVLSNTPNVAGTGLQPRPAIVRTFAVATAGGYVVLPGGLGRVAPTSAAVAISNAEGAIAKDLWVLADEAAIGLGVPVESVLGTDPVFAAISPRIAADLFWLGRYAERAESMARLIGICDSRWREGAMSSTRPDRSVEGSLPVLLATLGELSTHTTEPAEPTDADIAGTLLGQLTDEHRPGTLAHDVRQLRELANELRDQLSGDTWAVLAHLERALAAVAPVPADAAAIPGALSSALEALLALAGLIGESMVRDPGWYLLDAGRRIERALQVARLVRGGLVRASAPAVEDQVVESVLVAAESIITHRRRYGAGAGVASVLSLLLFDRDNPRGLAYQLEQLRQDLHRVSNDPTADAELTDRLSDLEAALHGTNAAHLARSLAGERTDLDRLLLAVIDELHQVAELIASTHFPPGSELQHFPGLDPVDSLELT